MGAYGAGTCLPKLDCGGRSYFQFFKVTNCTEPFRFGWTFTGAAVLGLFWSAIKTVDWVLLRVASGTVGGGAAVTVVIQKEETNAAINFKLVFIVQSQRPEYGLNVMPSTAIPLRFAAVAGS